MTLAPTALAALQFVASIDPEQDFIEITRIMGAIDYDLSLDAGVFILTLSARDMLTLPVLARKSLYEFMCP